MKNLLLNSSYYVMNYQIIKNNNYILSIKENLQYLYFFLNYILIY